MSTDTRPSTVAEEILFLRDVVVPSSKVGASERERWMRNQAQRCGPWSEERIDDLITIFGDYSREEAMKEIRYLRENVDSDLNCSQTQVDDYAQMILDQSKSIHILLNDIPLREACESMSTDELTSKLSSATIYSEANLFQYFELEDVDVDEVSAMASALQSQENSSESIVQDSLVFNKAFYGDRRNAIVDTHNMEAAFLGSQQDKISSHSHSLSGKPDGVSRRIAMMLEIKTTHNLSLLHQGIGRVHMMAKTHNVFNRFFVLMTDRHSQCWLAHIDRSQHVSIDLQLWRISPTTLCKLWRAFTVKAEKNPHFFLSPDADTLLDVVRTMNWPWQQCKIDLIDRSSSRVYAVYLPVTSKDGDGKAHKAVLLDNENAIVIKVNPDEVRFSQEVKVVEKIAPFFGESFYALGHYHVARKCVKWLFEFDIPLEGDVSDVFELEKDLSKASLDSTTSKVKWNRGSEKVSRSPLSGSWFYDGTLIHSPYSETHFSGALLMRMGSEISEDIDKSQMLQDLMNGLGVIHQAGVVHCDIRPRNIMFFGKRGFQLIDFDLARILDDQTRQVTLLDISVGSGQARGFPRSKKIELRGQGEHGSLTWKASDDMKMLLCMFARSFDLCREDIMKL